MAKENETSIWKKEISFRRKPKPEPTTLVQAARRRRPPTSVWKKEITFRRKPKQEAARQRPSSLP